MIEFKTESIKFKFELKPLLYDKHLSIKASSSKINFVLNEFLNFEKKKRLKIKILNFKEFFCKKWKIRKKYFFSK